MSLPGDVDRIAHAIYKRHFDPKRAKDRSVPIFHLEILTYRFKALGPTSAP